MSILLQRNYTTMQQALQCICKNLSTSLQNANFSRIKLNEIMAEQLLTVCLIMQNNFSMFNIAPD